MEDSALRKARRNHRLIGAITVLQGALFVYNLAVGAWGFAIFIGTPAGLFLAVWWWSRRQFAYLNRLNEEVEHWRREVKRMRGGG